MAALKVAGQTDPISLAGAIASTIEENDKAELMAIGAAAINQTVKAIAIARGLMAPNGFDLVFTPGFKDIDVKGSERTAIRFVVEPR